MFGLQPTHLAILVIVALLIFGPSRLPEIGRAFGKTLREFQDVTKETTRSLREEMQKIETPRETLSPFVCSVCGNPIKADMKFCPTCGTAQMPT